MASRSVTPGRAARVCAVLFATLVFAGSLATAPPAVAQTQPRFDVLVFSRTTGFRHTAAINAGRSALTQMGVAQDFNVTLTEDAGEFTSHNLRNFDVVVFLNTDGEGILNAAQRTAFERWMQRGGGAVSIHADANADKAWAWKRDMMGGGLFDNHPPIQQAMMDIVDRDHPATAGLPPGRWQWTDEWYNFEADPREKVHVLITVDESTYTGGEHGAGHPVAWCTNYDGGRHFYTAIGHADGGATPAWEDANYLTHISGALEWAAGEQPGDCGAPRDGLPTDASLNKVTLDDETENPMELAVAIDGRVFFVEIGAGALDSFPSAVKMYDPETDETYVVGNIDVHRRNENGLLGVALDPNFDSNNFVYLFYSVPGPQNEMGTQHISRFTFDPEAGEVGELDMSSEVVLLEIPHQRRTCCHSAGSLAFGPDGFLYATTADDTTPFQTDGYAPIDARECGPGPGTDGCTLSDPEDARHAFDARRSSGNTADLRGKLLRIDPIESATPEDEPGVGSTYEVDDTNLFTSGQYDHLFPGGEYDPDLGRPEIYAMGFRNPFRFTVDPETGWVYLGQVGPDAGSNCFPTSGGSSNQGGPCSENPRGPRGYDTLNQIREAANMGWPFCLAGEGYYQFDYATGTSGDQYDCEGGPTNDSPLNTGIDTLPRVTEPLIWYPYGSSPEFPEIPPAGSRAAMGGPIYHYDPELDSDVKLSEYFDGKLFWGDWTRNLMLVTTLDSNGDYVTTEELMPAEDFRHPHDIEIGPDGALYIIEWGNNFNFAAQGINPDSGLYRIEQRTGGLPALAEADASPRSGSALLEVQFTGELSDRGADDPPTYEWDFGDGETSTEVNPTHTYTEVGIYEATLTVTDEAGVTTDTVTINVREAIECGPPRSDEFDGEELDSKWEVIRRDDERLSVSDGALHLVSAPQDIFGGETGLPNIVLQPMPGGGSGAWSITTEMTWEPTQNFQNAGLMVYVDDDNYIKTGMVWNGARNFELIKETSGGASFEGTVSAAPVGNRYFLRLVSENGNDITSQFSPDGETWTEIGTTTLEGLVDPRFGVYATASTQAGAGQPTASFHSVTIEPDREECPTQCPSDEFDAAELDTEKWSFLHPSTETDPFVEDGHLVLTHSSFSFDADRPGPASVLATPMPLDDWEVIAKISSPDLNTDDTGQSLFAKVGLIVWQVNDNEPNKHFISYTHVRNADDQGETTFFEASGQNGPEAGDRTLGARVGQAPAAENLAGPYWIRITRTGDEIEGFYSLTDPEQSPEWVSINAGSAADLNIEEFMPADEGPIYVGPYGANGSTEARYDYVRFSPEDPECDGGGEDTIPPVTTHTLDPDEPDQGPVEVTLSATDPGEGGGEPQTHDVQAQGAVWNPDELDLASGDVVTWHFDDPPAQFPHDVWLVPPGGNPAPGGGDLFEVTDGIVPAGGPPVSHTFEEQGTWTFICRVHSAFSGGQWTGMVGTAEVGPGSGDEPSRVDFTEYRINTDGATGDWVRSDNAEGDDPFETAFTVSEEGAHEVEYRSTDNAGNVEDIKSVEFEIEGEPEPGAPIVQGFADPSSGAAPLTVRFSATALDPDGGPVRYRWVLENGTVLGSSFTYTFTETGEYVATVTATDDEGDTASEEVTVTVGGAANAPPTVEAGADVTSGPAPLAVQFDATGDDPDGPEGDLVYAWDFGDGGASFERRPRHVYMEPGTYTATVTVEDAGGASATDTVQITVGDPPGNRAPSVDAAALPGSGPAPLEVLFTAEGTDPDGDELTYEWDFGDGSDEATGASVSHTYTAAGTYTATVTASDGNGGTDTAEVQVVVGNPPANQAPTVQAAADPSSGAAPLTVRFSSAARDPDGDPLLYVWSFGDGGQAGGASATHTYGAPGTYTATVTVTDPDGATGTATVQVTVTGVQGLSLPPLGGFAPQPEVAGTLAAVRKPSSVRAFRMRGLRLTISCEATATGRATLRVSRRTANRLRLGGRTVASRAVRCVQGRDVSLRLKPRRSAARRLTATRRLRVTLRWSIEGAGTVQRRLTIGSRR
jgi:PKD repeat protein/glucose/arabinose dehydrogenase